LSAPDDLSALRIPRDERGPVFAEPWEAQAFALAVQLSGLGHFTWTEWAAALASELAAAAGRGEPDDGSRYYHHWLMALERLVTEKGLTNTDALRERKEAWADAYRHTPHGKPVELGATDSARVDHLQALDCGRTVRCAFPIESETQCSLTGLSRDHHDQQICHGPRHPARVSAFAPGLVLRPDVSQ
jgi:nitrile hydratase accessory protein